MKIDKIDIVNIAHTSLVVTLNSWLPPITDKICSSSAMLEEVKLFLSRRAAGERVLAAERHRIGTPPKFLLQRASVKLDSMQIGCRKC